MHTQLVPGLFPEWSPDGTRLASGSQDRSIRVWDVESGIMMIVLRGHDERVTSVAFSPDGKVLASCSWDGTVRVWGAP